MSRAAILAAYNDRIAFIEENPTLTIRQISKALKVSYIQSWRLVHGYRGRARVRETKLAYKAERAVKVQTQTAKSKNVFDPMERGNWMV